MLNEVSFYLFYEYACNNIRGDVNECTIFFLVFFNVGIDDLSFFSILLSRGLR